MPINPKMPTSLIPTKPTTLYMCKLSHLSKRRDTVSCASQLDVCRVHCRCVLNWFGDWSTGALYQVGLEFTNKVDLDKSDVSSHQSCSLRL